MKSVCARDEIRGCPCEMTTDHNKPNSGSDNTNNNLSESSDIDKIMLLIFLYFLQGIPLGMTSTIPLMLQAQPDHPADLPKRLALFSTSAWPFTFKFVFAPAIDSLKLPFLGVRKSWLLISQTGIGMALMIASSNVYESVLSFNVRTLLSLFLPICLCAAVQDVAVDGWALSLLRTPSWASTCNCVGQSAGFIFGMATLTLIDWRFANQLFWWLGIIFILSTLIILILKKENNAKQSISAITAYREMIEVIRLPSFALVAVFHLTSRISFAVVDHVLGLQLIKRGTIARKSLPSLILMIGTPIQIFLPFVVGKIIASQTESNGSSFKTTSLGIFMWLYRPRMLSAALLSAMTLWMGKGCRIGRPECVADGAAGLLNASSVDVTSISSDCYGWVTDSDRCIAFAGALLILFVTYKVFAVSMFVATMAFHAEISDTRLAGTCMTLANAVANLGAAWPGVIVLYLASTDSTTFDSNGDPLISNSLSTRFGLLSVISFVTGFIWYRVFADDLIHQLGKASWFRSARKRES